MSHFLQKRWHPLVTCALIIFLAASNPTSLSDLFGLQLSQVLRSATLFLAYAILSFLLARALAWGKDLPAHRILSTFALILLFAVAIQLYQILIPNRGFTLGDLLFAGWGTLLGLVAFTLWHAQRSSEAEDQDILL